MGFCSGCGGGVGNGGGNCAGSGVVVEVLVCSGDGVGVEVCGGYGVGVGSGCGRSAMGSGRWVDPTVLNCSLLRSRSS